MLDGQTKSLKVGVTEELKATKDRDVWKVMIAYATENGNCGIDLSNSLEQSGLHQLENILVLQESKASRLLLNSAGKMDPNKNRPYVRTEYRAKQIKSSPHRYRNSESDEKNRLASQQRMLGINNGNGQGTDVTQDPANIGFAQNIQAADAVGRRGASNSLRKVEESLTRSVDCQVPTVGQKLITAAKTGDLPELNRLLQLQQSGSEHFVVSQDHLNVSLLEACREGRKFIVQKLVRSGAEVNVRGNKRCTTPLHIAAEQGFVDIAAFLLDKDADVDANDHHGNSALILAVNRAGSSDMLNLLLVNRARVEHQNAEGVTALMKAVEVMDIDAIRILMFARSKLKQKNRQDETARDIAVGLGIADVFDSLISETEEHFRHSYLADSRGALTQAALMNQAEAVRILLDCRYLKNEVELKKIYDKSRTENHNTKISTLMVLIKSFCSDAQNEKDLDSAKFEIFKIILGSGVDAGRGQGPLLSWAVIDASEAGIYDLVEVLCKKKKVTVNMSTENHSALMIAAKNGRLDIVKLLLNFGADPRLTNKRMETALKYALSNGHTKCANALLQKNKPSEQCLMRMAEVAMGNGQLESLKFLASQCNINKMSQTLLKEAVLTRDSRFVQFLVDHGADINKTCDRDYTALLVALDRCRDYSCWYKDMNHGLFDMIKFLVGSGARVNGTFSKDSPLVVALKRERDPDVIHFLLDHGADVNEVGDNKGNTPLIAAITGYTSSPGKELLDVLGALLKKGANPNRANRDRDTALHLAACMDNLESIKLLIDAGADLEARNSDGFTPMLRAAKEGQPEVIMLLKDCGANMNAVDKDGKNAVFLSIMSATLDRERKLKLLASDVDEVNTQTSDGQTPLILAADSCDLKAIEILLEAGADPNKINNKKNTALSILLASNQNGSQT
ncbi:hypothetical protein RRG08_047580 [Elysia crispata]|uniref:ANK_REP_REGION domain-containing protein n=1 Tax=Elysia crispata TaxID=231223 RepID=A0AAE1AHX3_9GAST|nr:hypothetical protein RRG08_047580 [Elysia crispata]